MTAHVGELPGGGHTHDHGHGHGGPQKSIWLRGSWVRAAWVTVLALLNRTPETPLNPADLADRSGVTRATMTGLLQGLETEGMIKRTNCTDDKRMSWVQLTPRARKYLEEQMRKHFFGEGADQAQGYVPKA